MNIKKGLEGGSHEGFTLLELLIVISIIAILSVALVLVLNPAEALKKSRDSQRISDLSTMKTALGLYLTSTTTPRLGGGTSDVTCKTSPTAVWGATSARIYYSLSNTTLISDTAIDGSTINNSVQSGTPNTTDGNGWIPVNFDTLTGGSPISNLPVDPVNTIAALGGITSNDLVYRYACSSGPTTFEIDAQLESDAYTKTDDKRAKDGGNAALYYEIGTNLKILGVGGGTDY